MKLWDTKNMNMTSGIFGLLTGSWGESFDVIDIERKRHGGVNIMTRLYWQRNGDADNSKFHGWKKGPIVFSCDMTIVDGKDRRELVLQIAKSKPFMPFEIVQLIVLYAM